jgi:GT2 family glycosyltransferase
MNEIGLTPSIGEETSRALRDSTSEASPEVAPQGFDEIAYLAAFPDVAHSIKTGQFRSALHHYRVHGQREDRLNDLRYQRASIRGNTSSFPPASIDAVYGCDTGHCLVYGWVKDDAAAPIGQLTILNEMGLWGTTQLVFRFHRKDVVDSLGLPDDRRFGFWTIIVVEPAETLRGDVELVVSAGAERKTFNCQIRRASAERFREIALEFVVRAQHFGDARVETFLQLDKGLGQLLIGFNRDISRRIARGALTLQFGSVPSAVEGSIVVCLLGKPELLSLQCAMFSRCRNIDRYEFIYVSNSPELAERLVKDATIASHIYGISIRLVILPGNAGFGIANGVAADNARSSRLLFVNPDVFPMELDWPSWHSQLVNNLPPEQVALFGVPLYYDDGSLMHSGMYFEVDTGLSFSDHRTTTRDMLRVEHYGKGAPPATASYLAARAVPAVTGAFISVDRTWFESLGCFSPEYILGHYEDADLCLKSLRAGKPAWIHPVPFLHFEGKGSTPRPAHEGASLVNRWHFTNVWGELVKTQLCGKTPGDLTLRGRQ